MCRNDTTPFLYGVTKWSDMLNENNLITNADLRNSAFERIKERQEIMNKVLNSKELPTILHNTINDTVAKIRGVNTLAPSYSNIRLKTP